MADQDDVDFTSTAPSTKSDVLDEYLTHEERKLVDESSGPSDVLGRIEAAVASVVPRRVRYRWVDVDVTVPETVVRSGQPLPFTVTIANRSPFPVPLKLTCSTVWGWRIDGYQEGRAQRVYSSPAQRTWLRGYQQYSFERTWHGHVQYPDGTTASLDSGTHELTCWIHVENAKRYGLYETVTLTVE